MARSKRNRSFRSLLAAMQISSADWWMGHDQLYITLYGWNHRRAGQTHVAGLDQMNLLLSTPLSTGEVDVLKLLADILPDLKLHQFGQIRRTVQETGYVR
jgi:hypothetical protein